MAHKTLRHYIWRPSKKGMAQWHAIPLFTLARQWRNGALRMIDLNTWYHAIHQITGGMALRFNKAAADDLREWAKALHVVAAEMAAAAEIDPGEGANADTNAR
jgi:endogenous inhibitor of DNA gyrase (YacG/DUF329 family)